MEEPYGNKFDDGETYELIYPEVTIDPAYINTNPKPTNYDVRLEATIGIYGTDCWMLFLMILFVRNMRSSRHAVIVRVK